VGAAVRLGAPEAQSEELAGSLSAQFIGRCPKDGKLWEIYGKSMGNLWEIYGKCMAILWVIYGK
jgi:hypothetical protein